MTTDEYRELFHLDVSMSTACPETGELKRASMLEQIADAGPGRVYPLAEPGAPPTIPRWRSLAVRRPDLMVDWDTDAQDNPDPYTIGEHSRGKVAWRCHRCGHRGASRPRSAATEADALPAVDGASSRRPSSATSSHPRVNAHSARFGLTC